MAVFASEFVFEFVFVFALRSIVDKHTSHCSDLFRSSSGFYGDMRWNMHTHLDLQNLEFR